MNINEKLNNVRVFDDLGEITRFICEYDEITSSHETDFNKSRVIGKFKFNFFVCRAKVFIIDADKNLELEVASATTGFPCDLHYVEVPWNRPLAKILVEWRDKYNDEFEKQEIARREAKREEEKRKREIYEYFVKQFSGK